MNKNIEQALYLINDDFIEKLSRYREEGSYNILYEEFLDHIKTIIRDTLEYTLESHMEACFGKQRRYANN